MTRGIYITISNAGDRLPQPEWALYISRTRYQVSSYCTMTGAAFLGEWHTPIDAQDQSVKWLVREAIDPAHVRRLADALAATAERFHPEAGVEWAVAEAETIPAVPA